MYPANRSERTGWLSNMYAQRILIAFFTTLLTLAPGTTLATGHAPTDAQTTVEDSRDVVSDLPEELQHLPPTAAGEQVQPDIPLHFVPPNVQALQELGRPGAGDSRSPAENMLPFRF